MNNHQHWNKARETALNSRYESPLVPLLVKQDRRFWRVALMVTLCAAAVGWGWIFAH